MVLPTACIDEPVAPSFDALTNKRAIRLGRLDLSSVRIRKRTQHETAWSHYVHIPIVDSAATQRGHQQSKSLFILAQTRSKSYEGKHLRYCAHTPIRFALPEAKAMVSQRARPIY